MATRPAILTDTVVLDGVVPEVGLILSQGASSFIVKVSGMPELLMLSVWLAGLAPSCTAWKLRFVGLTTKTSGFTVKVTGTLTGELLALAAVIVMVAL